MITYDESYYYNMLKIYTPTAKKICGIRWDLIMDVYPKTVLDYGCGIGWMKAFSPAGVEVDTIDLMPVPQTGIRHNEYDVVCFWDVLEHLPDFEIISDILARSDHAAITIPMLPSGNALKTWKHFKPGEHLHYFDDETIIALFDRYDYDLLIDAGEIECPPRQDIRSFVFRNRTRRGETDTR